MQSYATDATQKISVDNGMRFVSKQTPRRTTTCSVMKNKDHFVFGSRSSIIRTHACMNKMRGKADGTPIRHMCVAEDCRSTQQTFNEVAGKEGLRDCTAIQCSAHSYLVCNLGHRQDVRCQRLDPYSCPWSDDVTSPNGLHRRGPE